MEQLVRWLEWQGLDVDQEEALERVYGTCFLVYVFSICVLSLAVLVDFIGLYQDTFLACFGSYSFWTCLD